MSNKRDRSPITADGETGTAKTEKNKKKKPALPVSIDSNQEVPIEKADFVEQKTNKETRKKAVVDKVFGIKKEDNITKRQKLYKTILNVAFTLFVIGVILYTAYKDFLAPDREFPSWEMLGNILKESWKYLAYALLSLLLFYFFKGFKLSVMCKSLTGKLHFRTCIETGIIGSYYNNVTPLAVGGQPFEIYHLSKHGVHGGAASSIPIAAFMLNQFAFVILGFTALWLFRDNRLDLATNVYGIFPTTVKLFAIIGLICCTLMPLLVVVFSLMPRIGARLVHFIMWLGSKFRLVKKPKETTIKTIKNVVHNAECLKKICRRPFVFIFSFLLSFLEHLANVSLAFFVLKAFGYDVWISDAQGAPVDVGTIKEWLQVAQVSLILLASISFIPTPGNSGAADLSFFNFFEVGLKAGLAFPATLIWRFFAFYSHVIIGFVFATWRKRYDHKKEMQMRPLTEEVPPDSPPPDSPPPNGENSPVSADSGTEAEPPTQTIASDSNDCEAP